MCRRSLSLRKLHGHCRTVRESWLEMLVVLLSRCEDNKTTSLKCPHIILWNYSAAAFTAIFLFSFFFFTNYLLVLDTFLAKISFHVLKVSFYGMGHLGAFFNPHDVRNAIISHTQAADSLLPGRCAWFLVLLANGYYDEALWKQYSRLQSLLILEIEAFPNNSVTCLSCFARHSRGGFW